MAETDAFRRRAVDRLAYLLHTHPQLTESEMLSDAMEDLQLVAPDGWVPPVDGDEARIRWEQSWEEEGVTTSNTLQ